MRVLRKIGSRPLAALAALTALLAAAPARAQSDVEFYAVTDADEVGVDDVLTLTVTVSLPAQGGGENLMLPEAPDFEVVSRSQSQQTAFSFGSGAPSFRNTRTYTILLSPRRPGTFTIKPGRLVVGGKAYETGAIRVKVVPGSAPQTKRPPPQQPAPANPFGFPNGLFGEEEDPEELLRQFFGGGRPTSDSDLYLRTFLDKKKAFIGEQVTFSTYLFSRVEVSGVDGLKMPKLDGFWAEDLEVPQQITGELKVIEGVPYRVFLLRKRALFPLKSGKATIDPVELDIATGFGLVLSGRKVHRASQPLALEVLPLPAGAPAGFEAANVGQWKLTAEASPTEVKLGEPVTLKVTLEGTGNLRQVVMPRLPEMRGLKSYDPTLSEKVSTTKGRYGGKRTAEYLLMPEQTGGFEIPSLRLDYFDPAAREYQTSATEPIAIKVEAGKGTAPAPGLGPIAGAPQRGVNVLQSDGARPIHFKAELARAAPPLYRREFFWPVAASPAALWLFAWGVGLVRAAVGRGGGKRGRIAASARRRLVKAEALLKTGKPDAFYAEVSRAFVDYLSDKLALPVGGLTRVELGARLTAAGLAPEAIARLVTVLDTCDAGRFAPGGGETATLQRVHQAALAAMQALEAARLAPAVEGAR